METGIDRDAEIPYKVIFLDCDGVLNRMGLTNDDRYFVPECFSEFQRIVMETGAKVVISSSWREYKDWYKMLVDFLGAIGIDVIGKTEVIYGNQREYEIFKYMENNKGKISNYVILDDWDMRKCFNGHCVCTTGYGRIGLDKEFADEAIAILNRQTGNTQKNGGR